MVAFHTGYTFSEPMGGLRMRLLSCFLVLMAVFQMSVGQAKVLDSTFSAHLFSVQTSPTSGNSVDGLFPLDPKPLPSTSPSPSPSASPSPAPGKPPVVITAPTPSSTTIVTSPKVSASFQCNLFENSEYADLLSSVNALNQAVNSPSCGGNDVNVTGILTNNKAIVDALKAIHAAIGVEQVSSQDPNAQIDITKDSAKVAAVISNVDVAIRAAAGLAKAFSSNDLLNKECREQMGGGDVAVALSNIINGLTPYALMASSLTGGTAAVPWIVGGTVLTSTISSIGKIISENSFKVQDATVRRAIVENTCQFIRMDQKYKFLIQNRKDQTSRITTEVKASQLMFTNFMSELSPETAELVNEKNDLDQLALNLEAKVNAANAQLLSDKQFMTGTSDDIKICQLGIQIAVINQDPESYVSTLLGSVELAGQAQGNGNTPQARALKLSADFAINSLTKMAQEPFTTTANFEACSKLTKSFVETLEQSGTFAKRSLKAAQSSLNQNLMKRAEYAQVQSQLKVLEQKQTLAQNVTNSLENLRSYANKFTQSEINAEMDRLRQGLFGARNYMSGSPVMAWFDYTKQLHAASVTKFKDGLRILRLRAYSLTAEAKSGKNAASALVSGPLVTEDQNAAYKLLTFNQKNLPVGTKAHSDACRELNDVWNRWVIAIDHLSAIESLCSMINPYIYDNRTEDRFLVMMCRGVTAHVQGGFQTPGTLESLKSSLLKEKSSEWSQYLKTTIDKLSCPQLEAN